MPATHFFTQASQMLNTKLTGLCCKATKSRGLKKSKTKMPLKMIFRVANLRKAMAKCS